MNINEVDQTYRSLANIETVGEVFTFPMARMSKYQNTA